MSWKPPTTNITTMEALAAYLPFSKAETQQLNILLEDFPMSISQYYLNLIDFHDPYDPIARMCIPSLAEFDQTGNFDTSGEHENTKEQGLQHKYAQTALILSTNQCASYCRHCFRRRLVGLSSDEILHQFHKIVAYIKAHEEITNVLISGGDSLCQENAMIKEYLTAFSQIAHLDFIRFGTRIPVVLPQRISEDEELLELLNTFQKKKQLYIITQFNHPRELTQQATLAIRKLRELGIVVKNQTVLLKGINDDPHVMGELLAGFTRIGIVPYYIFQCRPVTGVKSHFQVPLKQGYEIVEGAKKLQNGQGKCFKYVMSHVSGKIEVLGMLDETRMLFKYHQAKNPQDYGKLYLKEIDETTTWIEEPHL